MTISVALFVTCLVENVRPKVGFDTIALLEDAGCTVDVPAAQVCCGQPNYNGGDRQGAIATAKHVIDAFLAYDYTVVPSGSCAGMLKHHYPQILKDEVGYRAKAEQLAAKIYELSEFLLHIGYEPRAVDGYEQTATYHDACAGLRELGIKQQPRALLQRAGVEITELKDTESCCGFGGTFCVKYPDVSSAMVDRKLQDIEQSGASLLLAGDLGCLLNIEGRLSRTQQDVQVRHFAEVLARGLDKTGAEIADPGIIEAKDTDVP